MIGTGNRRPIQAQLASEKFRFFGVLLINNNCKSFYIFLQLICSTIIQFPVLPENKSHIFNFFDKISYMTAPVQLVPFL